MGDKARGHQPCRDPSSKVIVVLFLEYVVVVRLAQKPEDAVGLALADDGGRAFFLLPVLDQRLLAEVRPCTKDGHLLAIDLDPNWKGKAVLDAVVDEIVAPGPVEVGLSAEGRTGLVLAVEEKPSAADDPDMFVGLQKGDVVVVSGG